MTLKLTSDPIVHQSQGTAKVSCFKCGRNSCAIRVTSVTACSSSTGAVSCLDSPEAVWLDAQGAARAALLALVRRIGLLQGQVGNVRLAPGGAPQVHAPARQDQQGSCAAGAGQFVVRMGKDG